MKLFVMVVLPALAISAAFCAQTSKGADGENGKKLFGSVGCYECHGYLGQGGTTGPRELAPPRFRSQPSQNLCELLWTRCRHFTVKVLTDSQLADIYAYLESIPQPPPAKSIPQYLNNNLKN